MSEEQIKVSYKGFEILLHGDEWSLYEGENNSLDYRSPSLASVKERANKLRRDELAMSPLPCILNDWREPERGHVTSISEDGTIWFKSEKGKRRKIRDRRDLFALCSENLDALKEFARLHKEADKTRKVADAIKESMLPLKLPKTEAK